MKTTVSRREENRRVLTQISLISTANVFYKDSVTVLKQCSQGECKNSEVFTFNSLLINYSKKGLQHQYRHQRRSHPYYIH